MQHSIGNSNRIIFFLLSFLSFPLAGQTDYQWWNNKHDIDGSKYWTEYMVLSPKFMGPNALPVPEMFSGRIPTSHHFETGLEGHYSKGDRTANVYLSYNFPLYSDKATLQVNYRPVEIYRTDTMTRDLRRSRELEPEGYSLGDFYISTLVQLIKDHDRLPDLMISANIKTASGNNLYAARHTDTPGYWFDATLGKKINGQGNLIQYHQLFLKAGFYSYQTYSRKHYQNDAFLYGAGMLTALRNINMIYQLTGYAGYFKNGDRPLVFRFIIESRATGKTRFRYMLQQGIHDMNCTTLRCSILFNLN